MLVLYVLQKIFSAGNKLLLYNLTVAQPLKKLPHFTESARLSSSSQQSIIKSLSRNT